MRLSFSPQQERAASCFDRQNTFNGIQPTNMGNVPARILWMRNYPNLPYSGLVEPYHQCGSLNFDTTKHGFKLFQRSSEWWCDEMARCDSVSSSSLHHCDWFFVRKSGTPNSPQYVPEFTKNNMLVMVLITGLKMGNLYTKNLGHIDSDDWHDGVLPDVTQFSNPVSWKGSFKSHF